MQYTNPQTIWIKLKRQLCALHGAQDRVKSNFSLPFTGIQTVNNNIESHYVFCVSNRPKVPKPRSITADSTKYPRITIISIFDFLWSMFDGCAMCKPHRLFTDLCDRCNRLSTDKRTKSRSVRPKIFYFTILTLFGIRSLFVYTSVRLLFIKW